MANILRGIRRYRGLNEDEFATKIGFSKKEIQAVAAGTKVMPKLMYSKIVSHFALTEEEDYDFKQAYCNSIQ